MVLAECGGHYFVDDASRTDVLRGRQTPGQRISPDHQKPIELIARMVAKKQAGRGELVFMILFAGSV